MKSTLCPATGFHGVGALPFVIPSGRRDLQFRGPLLEMFLTDRSAVDAVLLPLLLQDGFGQVAGMVDIDPVLNGQLVGEQLQRNDLQHGG